jgi:uncharacterized protein
MPQYLSPGVYVEEVPPLARPIAGVGTSTAGFIGVIPETINVPNGVPVKNAFVGKGDDNLKSFPLDKASYPVATTPGTFEVRVNDKPAKATLSNDDTSKTSSVDFESPPKKDAQINADYYLTHIFSPVTAGELKLCTSFSEFKKLFGDFSLDQGQRILAHAVYGFFNNGGSRCYVVRVSAASNIETKILPAFEAIDEIAIVAAPGVTSNGVPDALAAHCQKTGDRFAILESDEKVEKAGTAGPDLTRFDRSSPNPVLPQNNSYAAFYFPWIEVVDPATQQRIYVPPSGHLAGIYARVDAQRGVHKAPANEAVSGALGLKYSLSKSQQDGLNPQGVNCIRNLNGNIYVWGARTLGGDANGEFKYISTRRLLNFLRESIEEGTQFVVFEPNDPALWQRIKRSVGDFLLGQWRAGALFGDTPDKAFFVKCDAETNPPDVREAGKVVTEIGVAIIKPAEFVIFRIQQQTGG